MILHEQLRRELLDRHRQLTTEGRLYAQEQLAMYYATFRARFAPDRLLALDGQALLETMHDHGNRESLVYWLEFKNDDEFSTTLFGSISGGSASKFGIYRSQKARLWMTGSSHNLREISTEEAIQLARAHREQLVRGAELLAQFPNNADDADYRRLQEELDRVAPDVSTKAWGHKYLHMLYPDKLDDFHVESYQRFHLIKILQPPPEGAGRYLAAGRYVAIARELGIPINHLTSMLNQRNGNPYRYWRVLVNYPDIKGWRDIWGDMRSNGYVAIGWAKVGDLSDITYDQASKDRVRALMKETYSDPKGWAPEVFSFVAVINPGDLVLAFERSQVLGIGRVTDAYHYDPSMPQAPHRRAVEWLSFDKWALPREEAQGRTVREIRLPENLVEVERRVLSAALLPPQQPLLTGLPGQIQAVLERKKQVILYGPPGTGKTYWAMRAAQDLAGLAAYGRPFAELDDAVKALILQGEGTSGPLVRVCTFHPAYGYEDFMEGYRPEAAAGQLTFQRQAGLFKCLCDDARRQPTRRFYLIIDEINRGDIPRIFGELLSILEKDKRGRAVLLPLSGEPFTIPENVYVIGTMNTADRSIALLDTALRRRFGFIELMPDATVLGNTVVADSIPLGPWLDALNERILEHIGRDARNLQIGHAYLLDKGKPVTDLATLARIVQEDILPLLEEYCYEDYATLARILGAGLVDEARQRIRHELFTPGRRDELIQALLAAAPEVTTSPQAVASAGEQLAGEDDENEEESEATPA